MRSNLTLDKVLPVDAEHPEYTWKLIEPVQQNGPMPSTFAWLDQDDNVRRRMLEVVDLFREKGTLDELGLGSIRDAFADRFFPGTSTIQTRVRYFLFVPWIYQHLEHARISSERAPSEARQLQLQLTESLLRGEPKGQSGIIGRQAKESLKRPPAMIYWNGLGIWGVRLFHGSIAQYHGSLSTFYQRSRNTGMAESGEFVEGRYRNWQAAIPPSPDGFLEKVDFRLRREEAQYLADQIRRHCENSLLDTCLRAPKSTVRKARRCWELVDLPHLDSDMRTTLEDSRRFAYLMEGAVLLYNLMLAEKQRELSLAQDAIRIDRYRNELDRWADEICGMADDLQTWDLDMFEHRMRLLNQRIPLQSFFFCQSWMATARLQPRTVADDQSLRLLITHRERQLKGGLARLHSPRALESWSGESALGKLDYRWGIGQSAVTDIAEGLAAVQGLD